MDFNKYDRVMAYPNHHDFRLITFGKVGMVMREVSAQQFFTEFSKVPELVSLPVYGLLSEGMHWQLISDKLEDAGFTVSTMTDTKGLDVAVAAYYDEEKAVLDQFKADLFAELGLTNLPTAFVTGIFDEAYSKGHSSGFKRIAQCLREQVSLCQPLIDGYLELAGKR